MRGHETYGDIQVLRGVAIAMVLACHMSLSTALLALMPTRPQMPLWLGVDLFFVISGFVVTRSVLRSDLSPFGFVVRRVFRLQPALLCFVALSALATFSIRYGITAPFAHKLFTGTPVEFTAQAVAVVLGVFNNIGWERILYTNSAIWSLGVEFQFYAGFWLVLVASRLASSGPAGFQRLLLGLCITLYLIVTACKVHFLWPLFPPQHPGLVLVWLSELRFDFLLLGVLTAFVAGRGRGRGKQGSEMRSGLDSATAVLLLLVPMMLLAMCESALAASKPVLEIVGMPVAGLCFAAVVLKAARPDVDPRQGRFYRAMAWLGDRSYSVYLFHYPINALIWLLLYTSWPWAFREPVRYGVIQAALVIPATLVLSDVVFRHIEKPWSRYGARLARSVGTDRRHALLPAAAA